MATQYNEIDPDVLAHPTAFLLGRAVSIIEGMVESPTDAIDIKMAQEFLVDYRRWMEAGS